MIIRQKEFDEKIESIKLVNFFFNFDNLNKYPNTIEELTYLILKPHSIFPEVSNESIS